MSACATGCVQLGAHKASCDGLNAATAECRGCTPREAAQGVLCGRCWGNLQRDVRTAPSIVDWIQQHVIPSGQQALMQESTVKIRGPRLDSEGPFYIGLASPGLSAEGREPLSAAAVDDADELHCTLTEWARTICDRYPGGLRGPRVIGQRRVVGGFVGGLMPDSDATTTVSKFLATHESWAAEQDWAGEMVDEISQIVRTLLARYPEAEKSRHMPEVLCPACGRSSMIYHPPAWHKAKILVQCDHMACGETVPEERFGHFMRLVEQQRREAS